MNLVFFANTVGTVHFEMMDELGATIKEEKIPDGMNFEEYATGNIASGIYIWRLRDDNRIIKTGKIVIIK